MLGTGPLIGRAFQRGDDDVNAAPVAILSYQLWKELGGDPSIVGRPLRLGGEARTIVGVMPRGFWFPSPATKLWTAAPFHPNNDDGNWTLVGRVASGARVDNMSGPLHAIASELGKRFSTRPSGTKHARRRSLRFATSSSATCGRGFSPPSRRWRSSC